ncbi:Ppx/GppA phosphatase family protein [Clostridium vincentii]|uniref:Guanosine-5'-triphosphate,3'-diphosphate pyrophosphatase n=1 Tax=Clostridium vincentii TaxID=52704 RepID=A0A2T0BBX0_9CLOT|nr:Ppx/GppA phosphatase family protein [Clostridium vincentii]PRR81307.1 Guanosine-5'-triphosphate,3'-diphosphate pyrophosphatase [Clostridium vincentii]
MNRVGVIVIGSNSVRFMLTEVEEGGYFRIIDELSSSVRLCSDLINGDEISSDRIQDILSTLRSFKSLYSVSGAKKVITVATESFRLSSNKDIVVKLIKEELDIDVTILSDEEEIYYTYLGVKNSMYFTNALIVDIAGSSTHVAWILDGKIKDSFTLPIGSVNLSYKYNLNDGILTEDLSAALSCIDDELQKLSSLCGRKFEAIIGIGGTVRALTKMDRRKKKYPLDVTHQYTTTDLDIHDMYNLVKSKNLIQRKRLEGLSPDRPDIIVGGAAIFQGIINYLGVQDVIVSGRGLKEGLMFEYITENYEPISDILDYSLNGLGRNLNINRDHADHVFGIITKLFEALKPLHKLGDKYNNVIKTASILHDCGISIDYYNHHRHSFYIILNSYINGLTHKELLMSAAISASHRNNSYHLPLPSFCSMINKLDIKVIDEIGVLLKISEGLDRSLEGAVNDLQVSITVDSVIITVFSDTDLYLEIKEALRATRNFKDIYNKDLIIEKG